MAGTPAAPAAGEGRPPVPGVRVSATGPGAAPGYRAPAQPPGGRAPAGEPQVRVGSCADLGVGLSGNEQTGLSNSCGSKDTREPSFCGARSAPLQGWARAALRAQKSFPIRSLVLIWPATAM